MERVKDLENIHDNKVVELDRNLPKADVLKVDFLTFTDEEYGIQIQYPNDWNYSHGIQRSMIAMIASFNPPSKITKENLIHLLSEQIKNKDEISQKENLRIIWEIQVQVLLYIPSLHLIKP